MSPVTGGGWALLRREMWLRRRTLRPAVAWSVLEAVPALLSGWLVEAAADRGFLAGHPAIGAAWLGGFALAQLLRAVATRALVTRMADVVESLRDAIVGRVAHGALHRAVHGAARPDDAALARITEQVQSIRGLLSAVLLEGRSVVISATTAGIGLAALSPAMAGLVLGPLALCLVAYVLAQRRLRTRQLGVLVADEEIARDTIGVLDALRDVLSCGARDRAAEALGHAVDAQAAAERGLADAVARRTLLIALAQGLPLLAVVAAPLVLGAGAFGPGAVLGAVTYVLGGLQPAVSSLLETLGGYGLQLGVTLDRIAAMSSVPPRPGRAGYLPRGFALVARDVTHAHGPHADPVVRGLSLSIAEGEHVAVVGPSGAGKSTLVDLLTGVVVPRHGAVWLGGAALPDIDEAALRRAVTLVPQEAFVLPGTLGENLRYLAPHATYADLDRATEALGLRRLVARTGGYDAALPADLGPAERQLVVLARVYLSPAAVVVLDEGTCHLDPSAEERVEAAFRRRPGTLVVVAHRMSSARRADRVVVLDGHTTAVGSHDTLLRTSRLYRDLAGLWAGAATPPQAGRAAHRAAPPPGSAAPAAARPAPGPVAAKAAP